MYAASEKVPRGRVDETMPGERQQAGETCRADEHMKVPAFARTGVTGVQGAVVANLEQIGSQGLLQTTAEKLCEGGVLFTAH